MNYCKNVLYLTYFVDFPAILTPPWWFRTFFNANSESRAIFSTHGWCPNLIPKLFQYLNNDLLWTNSIFQRLFFEAAILNSCVNETQFWWRIPNALENSRILISRRIAHDSIICYKVWNSKESLGLLDINGLNIKDINQIYFS